MLCITAVKEGVKVKKKTWKNIITLLIFLAVTAALIILPMSVKNKKEQPAYEYVSAQAELREISSSLSGGGPVNAQDKEDVTLPEGVEITRFLVSNGEEVAAGQPVAEVDTLTVLAAVARVRDSMVTLEKNITELVNSGSDASVRCVADGRVKAVYAKSGDDVRSVIIDNGALGIVSLDGLMCAEVACDSGLLTGDPVKVTCADGKEYPGRVSSSLDGALTVTITDDGPEIGDIVVVYDNDGELLGSGVLKVNSPWKVVYADGTVGSVNMKAGQKVKKGTILVRLKDTGLTEKESYSRKHREYEDLLQDLLKMLTSGQITAPCDGFISGVDKTKATGLGAEPEHKITLLAYYGEGDPKPTLDKVYNLVVVTASIGSVNLGKVVPLTEADINDLSAMGIILSDPSTFPLLKQEWVSAKISNAEPGVLNLGNAAGEGDIFLIESSLIPGEASVFYYFGHLITTTPEIDISGIGGFGGGGASDDEEPDMFPTDEDVILSVTPTEEMSITISVDELDILRYSVGMPADIYIDALPGESFTGTVTKIAAVGTNSGGSSKYEVTVALPYSDRILPGMNASVVIHTGNTGNVVTVPAAALSDSGSKCLVYTAYDEKNDKLINPVTVEIGASDGDFVEILSGLDVGQTIWYASYPATN